MTYLYCNLFFNTLTANRSSTSNFYSAPLRRCYLALSFWGLTLLRTSHNLRYCIRKTVVSCVFKASTYCLPAPLVFSLALIICLIRLAYLSGLLRRGIKWIILNARIKIEFLHFSFYMHRWHWHLQLRIFHLSSRHVSVHRGLNQLIWPCAPLWWFIR